MPGKASLAAHEYYAYAQNAFWRIVCELLGADPGISYADRIEVLESRRIALWDVMHSCKRQSSLDSDILEDSIVANDFQSLFDSHPNIDYVFFNGAKAEHAFRKYVLPHLGETCANMTYQRLPSTSPAHAGMKYADKMEAWRVILS
jgi:hypoxanthine-DNA glycosylase